MIASVFIAAALLVLAPVSGRQIGAFVQLVVAAGYALLNYLMDPANAVREHIANGAPATDSRVISLLPKDVTSNKIVYPDEASLTPLEFGAAVTLTDPGRAELMARFKSA